MNLEARAVEPVVGYLVARDTVAGVLECKKHYYRDQASARLALEHVLKKVKPEAKLPRRVYPCDVCDGWHLTSRKVSGKTPPCEPRA